MGLISFLKINQALGEYQKLNCEDPGKPALKFKHEESLHKAKVSIVDEKKVVFYLQRLRNCVSIMTVLINILVS